MSRQPRHVALPAAVRTRRAYFDCKIGQLHVRTAFPATGGFDERVTLLCLHPSGLTSRIFDRFLTEIANDRSVYAPDLPGCGESDAAPTSSFVDAADALSDFANDLRLRQIDVLGYRDGGGVAVELAAARPELVRRLVLVGLPPLDKLPRVRQDALILRSGMGAPDDVQWARTVLPNARFSEFAHGAENPFDAVPARGSAHHIRAFLEGRL